MGFDNIRLYNGGIKDWQKNGYAVEVRQALPEAEVSYIDADTLSGLLLEYEQVGCYQTDGRADLTILDLRDANHLQHVSPPPEIRTNCPVVKGLLDDLLDPQVRAAIPQYGQVVTLTETGNRDEFAIRYLSQFGYKNMQGLRFGMRDWLKKRLPLKE